MDLDCMVKMHNETTDQPSSAKPDIGWRQLRHPYVVRLVVWVLLLSGSVTAVRVFPMVSMAWQNAVGHALLELCAALVSLGVAYCFWVQYRVSTKRQMLLASIAFSGITSGYLAHAFTSAMQLGAWQAYMMGHQFQSVWKALSALLLIAAALSTRMEDNADCRRNGLKTLWSAMALPILIFTLGALISRAADGVHPTLTPGEMASLSQIVHLASSHLALHVLDMVAIFAALVAFAWRHLEDEDAFSDGIVRYLCLALVGMLAAVVSSRDFDLSWWAAHVLGIVGLLVLLVELAREFGASYSDAQTRVEHLEAVHRISSQLTNTLDLRVVLLVLASDIADMLQARYASVMMVDDTGETLRTVATHGLPESPLKNSEPQKIEGSGRPGFYSGHTARAFREKRICMVDDVFTDVEFVPWRLLAQCNGYAVSVPLVYQDVALGVLNLFFDSHVPVNDERMRLFETLASAAAVAIANAQLYDRALEAHPSESDTANLFRLRLAA